MKIGMVTHYMPPHQGGIERVAEMLFAAYSQRGFEVRWVASQDPPETPRREGARVRVPCWNGLERRLGVPVPIWGVSAWQEMRRLTQWADVLHVHDCLYPGSALGVALGRSAKTPVILSQHIGFVHYRAAALRELERLAFVTLGRWMLRHATRIALATPAAEAYVSELLRKGPLNASVVPNGIDTERFRPVEAHERAAARSELGLPPDQPVVLFVGRLVERKGIDLVVEVSRQVAEAVFLIVGDGPLAGLVPEGGNVVWHRSVPPDQMPAYYHAADCLLLPSHGEGLPLAVQEAAACGLPMVVSEDEVYAGPLLRACVCAGARRSPECMARGVRQALAGDGSERGAVARRFAEAHWSVKSMAARYVALIEEVAAAAGRTRQSVRAH